MSESVPNHVLEALDGVEATIDALFSSLEPIVNVAPKDLERNLLSAQRAKFHLTLAYALNASFAVHLATKGVSLEDHPIQEEIERTKVYTTKLQRLCSQSGRKPSSSVDVAAANRFISHSVPDLTSEQKRKLKEAGEEAQHKKRHKEKSGKKVKDKTKPLSVVEEARNFIEDLSKDLNDRDTV